MQITVKDVKVKEGITKSGKNEGKPWKLVILEGIDGKEYTTFDSGAAFLQPGAIIKIDQITLKTKDNGDESRTFKEFAIVSAPTLGPAPTNGDKGMTPEAWAEKDRLERRSIEAQVCLKCACEIAKEGDTIDKILLHATKMREWVTSGIAPTAPTIAVTAPKVQDKGKASSKASESMINDFQLAHIKKVMKDKGYSPNDIKVWTGGNFGKVSSTELTQAEAAELIQALDTDSIEKVT